ncbi:MAG: hypothetical protein R3C05_01610 [Pirellulaceae bacterium]
MLALSTLSSKWKDTGFYNLQTTPRLAEAHETSTLWIQSMIAQVTV